MKRTGLVIGLGVDIASVALFVLGRVLSAYDGVACALPVVPVVVAARDVPQGALIDSTAVYVARWPVGTPPAGAYTTIDAAVGRISDRDVRQGDVLVPILDRLAREQPTDRAAVKSARARADGVN